jgi:hypothetical protein
MAFIAAGIVEAITIAIAILFLFGGGMSDNPSDNSAAAGNALMVFVIGSLLAFFIGASHFIHFTW